MVLVLETENIELREFDTINDGELLEEIEPEIVFDTNGELLEEIEPEIVFDINGDLLEEEVFEAIELDPTAEFDDLTEGEFDTDGELLEDIDPETDFDTNGELLEDIDPETDFDINGELVEDLNPDILAEFDFVIEIDLVITGEFDTLTEPLTV